MAAPRRATPVAILLLVATLACVAVTVALFGRAYPLLDAPGRIDRADALARAQAFVAAERLAPADARSAIRYETDDAVSTYVDLAAGGPDTLAALARGRDVALAWWAVRFFRPGDPHETVVRLAARDGRLIGVLDTLAEATPRPEISAAEARRAGDDALARWAGYDLAQWRVVAGPTSKRQAGSGRVDWSLTYEHRTRRIGDAPLRVDVVATGADSADASRAPGASGAAAGKALHVRPYVRVPESFTRRYAEMRGVNDLYANFTNPLALLYIIAGVVVVIQLRRRELLRARPAVLVGGAVGTLLALAIVNQLPTLWFSYDTALPPTLFVVAVVFGAVFAGLGGGLLVATMLAAAEGLTRLAFPRHWDWYAFWRHRGTREMGGRVLAGYALCALGFAYVTTFYLAMRRGFGWWVPTSALDDPNQIATPLPWVSAFGLATFAGIWEEAAFRAIPLALLALWTKDRPNRRAWMAAGVVVTALVFGFGHANYPSWPPYSRGVELFLEAALWAVLYLSVGLPTTIVAHVAYDLTWFGLFAAQGSTPAYRLTLAIVLAALFFPALAVLQKWLAQGGRWAEAPETARLAAWRLTAREGVTHPRPTFAPTPALAPTLRTLAVALSAAGLVLAAAWRPQRVLGPSFTASPARAGAAADSVLRARGEDPARWRRFVTAETRGPSGVERRFFDREKARARAESLATSYLPAARWEVRYVRTRGTLDVRGEEWRVGLLPDGRVLDVNHRIPESRAGASPDTARARALADAGIGSFVPGAERARLREIELSQAPTTKSTRVDTWVTYEDTTARLPAGARARVRVALAGDTARAGGRDVQLPEAFERADRGTESSRQVAASVGGVLAFALFIYMLVGAMRTPPAEGAAGEGWVDRPRGLALAGFGALAMALATTLAMPSMLAGWDSAKSFSNHVTMQWLQVLVTALVYGAGILGLWYLADALRRRAGLPVWPAGEAAPRDAVLAGAAMGLGAVAAQYVAKAVAAARWPVPPQTSQDALVPLLAGASSVLTTAAVAAMYALPAAALALGARTWRGRILVLLLAAACVVPVVRLSGGASAGDALAAVLATAGGLAAAAATVLLVRAYGLHSGAAWVHAALFAALAGQVQAVRAAASDGDRASGFVGAAAAVLLVGLLYRATVRRAGTASLPDAAPPADAGVPAGEVVQVA